MSEGISVVAERLLENSSIKSKEKAKDIRKWRKRKRSSIKVLRRMARIINL